jgi:hypothetical protein
MSGALLAGAVLVVGIVLSGLTNRKDTGQMTIDVHQTLASDAKDWYFAASQDSHPVLGLMHCTAASVKLQVLESMCSTEQIRKTCSINPLTLRRDIRKLQHALLTRLSEKYPTITMDLGAGSSNWYV